MEQEAQHGGRERFPSDGAWLEELLTACVPNLREGSVDGGPCLIDELTNALRWVPRPCLEPERGLLSRVELRTARIGEESVETARDVTEMVAKAGRTIRAEP